MEGLVIMFWAGRRVFITGHTGFKGAWLSLWLQGLGANLAGFSLPPPSDPSLFELAQVGSGMHSMIGDINDIELLSAELARHRPEIVFHLAAQPLVRHSYQDPIGTYRTNVIGTANILESVRRTDSVRAAVIITTDKCYENREWIWPYRETDALGGHDPYSSSKACAELVVSAYRNSFFPVEEFDRHRVAIGSVRAGNVIGGGDWARDRLIPDIIRAFSSAQPVSIRNPNSIRPWQHVLEPLRGYMILAERLYSQGVEFGGAWNFGPRYMDAKSVEWIVNCAAQMWGRDAHFKVDPGEHLHEAQTLKLDWTKASQALNWTPTLELVDAMELTISWYNAYVSGSNCRDLTLTQIADYSVRSGFPLAAHADASADVTSGCGHSKFLTGAL